MASMVRARGAGMAIAVATLLAAGACTAHPAADQPPAGGTTSAAPVDPGATNSTPSSTVIDFTGLPDLKVGATLAELVQAGVISTTPGACSGTQYTGDRPVSPVFDAGRLVLIWADPPLHTPEGVQVGVPVATVTTAYPGAVPLPRPSGSTQYDGLLVTGGGDRAYLLLHDGAQVQKLVVGFETYARRLFDTGFGTC